MKGNPRLRRALASQHYDQQVILRRGSTTLDAQAMRIASASGSAERDSGGGAGTAAITITGPVALNIQPGDRLTVDNIVYTVTFVRPRRDTQTVADATAQS